MDDMQSKVFWYGRRWLGAAPLEAPVGGPDWRTHYSRHRSFTAPTPVPSVDGAGVAILDVADFTAVQATHALRGEWYAIGVVPDLAAGSDDYEVRLQSEARVYGGLRDLELAAVARTDGVRCVFIVDVPGRPASEGDLAAMAAAVWDLRTIWDVERPVRSGWPAVCRMLNLWAPPDTADAGPWERFAVPAGGGGPPEGAQIVSGEPRCPVAAPPLLFRSGERWLAIGRPHALSEFAITRLSYESARLVLGVRESAWPEPGERGPGPARRYLAANRPARTSHGPDAYLDSLAGHDRGQAVTAPEDAPDFVRRWLGAALAGGGD